MKKKLTSESGIFVTRLLPAFLLGAIGVWLAIVGLRAQSPQSGQTTSFRLADGSAVYPAGWAPRDYANAHELWNTNSQKIASLSAGEQDQIARIRTGVTPCASHSEAVLRLREVEAESKNPSQYVVIGGWPALVRRQIIDRPRAGDEGAQEGKLVMVTTAVAAGSTIVRMDGFAPETASPDLIGQMESIGRSWQPAVAGDSGTATKDVEQLRSSDSLRMPPAASPSSGTPSDKPGSPSAPTTPSPDRPSSLKPIATTNLGAFANLQIGSESEITVSANGTYIVVAQGCSDSNSVDGGATFTAGGFPPGHCTGGDSSVAFGKSGNFYWETIDSNTPTCPAGKPNCNNTQGIARSTDNGQNFTFVTNTIDCLVTAGCGFGNVPDQEHIAADRVNASSTSQDQVYMAFRQGFGFGLQCSTDSGGTWSAVQYFNNGSTDFPRITVSQNGTVYVATNNGNNIEIWSFSSCQSGLTPGLNHVTIASGINQVPCPVAGLDRCNNGNILSSHTVAVDDTNASHLYAAYAVNTVAPAANASFPGNENVLVRESTDGGSTWSSAVQINGGTSGNGGRRFQPWVNTTQGKAYVSWFDRRASTSGNNDLTDYYGGNALDSPGLTAGTEFQIDVNADPQCATGWPCGSRSNNDSGSCSSQPQFGGQCRHNPNNSSDSFQGCDLNNSPTCSDSTETCQTGGGCPKYADYTGNAALLGRFYTAYPSATNQPGAAATGGNIVTFFSETVVGPTDTTTTYTGDTSGVILSSANLSATLVLKGTSVPVAGKTITFTLGSQSCFNSTNSSGVASCSIILNQTPGNYTVKANFAGSGNYNASSDSKPFTIIKATPNIATTASAATTLGNKISDTASVTAGDSPTGTVTFKLYGFIDSTCSSAPVATATVALSGSNATSPLFTPTQAGTYHYIATYNGDVNNFAVATTCGDPGEAVVVSGTSVTGSGSLAAACGKINFTLSAKRNAQHQIVATMYYNDACAGLHFDNPVITSLTFNGNQVLFGGTVKVLGNHPQNVNFSVTLTDNGLPGTLDKLSITMSSGYSLTANLATGNIAIK